MTYSITYAIAVAEILIDYKISFYSILFSRILVRNTLQLNNIVWDNCG